MVWDTMTLWHFSNTGYGFNLLTYIRTYVHVCNTVLTREQSKSQGSSHRAGADRIGLVELWSARRFAEYQADQLIKDPNVQQKYFWEWQHGFKEGIKGFNTAING